MILLLITLTTPVRFAARTSLFTIHSVHYLAPKYTHNPGKVCCKDLCTHNTFSSSLPSGLADPTHLSVLNARTGLKQNLCNLCNLCRIYVFMLNARTGLKQMPAAGLNPQGLCVGADPRGNRQTLQGTYVGHCSLLAWQRRRLCQQFDQHSFLCRHCSLFACQHSSLGRRPSST